MPSLQERRRGGLYSPPPVDTSPEAYRAVCEQLVEIFYQDLPDEVIAQEITPQMDKLRKMVQADGGPRS